MKYVNAKCTQIHHHEGEIFLKHSGTATIHSARLTLRPFSPADAQAMYANWASDTDVTKYLMWPTHSNAEETRGILQEWVGHYSEPDYYHWAITLRAENNMLVGSIAVVQKDDRVNMAHIGYCLGKPWWNQGIASEALRIVIHYLFTTVGINRIESRHDPRNPNSGKVMLTCGLQYEGTLREADWNNQGICDAAMYALLKKDYNG